MAKKQLFIGNRLRYTDEELGILKATFAEEEDLLIIIRKFLLQGEFTKDERAYMESYTKNPRVVELLRKALGLKIEKGANAFQTVDMFTHMDLKPIPADHAFMIIKAKHLEVKYLNQQIDILEGTEVKDPISFDSMIAEGNDQETTFINMLARNDIISHVDQQLFNGIFILAGLKDETPEEQKERVTKDSSK